MPYKSSAQRGAFHLLAKSGKISARVVKEFDTASKGLKLPKRAKAKTAKAMGSTNRGLFKTAMKAKTKKKRKA